MSIFKIYLIISFIFLMNGCRGYSSDAPPFHVNPNMDTQQKLKPYREEIFFADHKSMRDAIDGTIAFGKLKDDEHFYFGKINGKLATTFPPNIEVNEKFIARGKQVYTSKCAACHSDIGNGEGLVGKRLMVAPTSFHSDYMYSLPPGHFFDVITNGIRTMKSYAHMIDEMDRWSVVAHLRALQISQDVNGTWIDRSKAWWKQ